MYGFRVSTRLVFLLVSLLQPPASPADTVAVRYPEGVSHGFLVLRTQEGKPIADGDSTQVARGDRVTSRMRFRFKDGSIYEETTVFSQHGTFLPSVLDLSHRLASTKISLLALTALHNRLSFIRKTQE
jgi:hypothetical protein